MPLPRHNRMEQYEGGLLKATFLAISVGIGGTFLISEVQDGLEENYQQCLLENKEKAADQKKACNKPDVIWGQAVISK